MSDLKHPELSAMQKWKMCESKRRYSKKKGAKEAAKKATKIYGKRWVYECSLCGGWHLTKIKPADAEKFIVQTETENDFAF